MVELQLMLICSYLHKIVVSAIVLLLIFDCTQRKFELWLSKTNLFELF